MAELRIPIIVENKGTKAFKSASRDINSLEKGVKKLGGALAATFGAQQLLKFAKNAAKAFIEDERAAAQLAQTVKNLGLAFETPRIEKFISEMSMASGVADDQLRPSMQKLLQVTGSVTKSQELLTQALDISRGSGVEFETVVQDLASAMVGKTRGLAKYNLGLSKAELTTISFTDAQKKLADTFKGANAAYLETYAGKMSILNFAAKEAQETIGKGLVDSLSLLAGEGNSIQPLADSMQDFAQQVSDAIYGVATLIDKIKQIPGLDKLTGNKKLMGIINPNVGIVTSAWEAITRYGRMNREAVPLTSTNVLSGDVWAKQNKERIAAEKKAAENQKKLAALQTKQLADAKKKLALDKASKTLNLEAIGIEAALKGKISESDRISLLLQKAILEGNANLATQLSDQLEATIKRQNELRQLLITTPEAPNPYRNWTLPQDLLTYTAASLGVSVASLQNTPVPPSSSFSDAQLELMSAVNSYQKADQQAINIEVYLDGDVVTGAITEKQVNQSLSGTFSSLNRSGGKGSVALL